LVVAIREQSAPTSDRLRADIDTGREGDKVGFVDPAAAPLGTDDEAAGTPPTNEQLRMAARDVARPPDIRTSGRDATDFPLVYLLITVPLIAAILALSG